MDGRERVILAYGIYEYSIFKTSFLFKVHTLEALAKHLGLFATGKNHSYKKPETLDLSNLTADERREIARLMRKVAC